MRLAKTITQLWHCEHNERALRLTVLCLLFAPVGDYTLQPTILMLVGAMVLSPALLRHALPWLILTLLTAWRVIDDWPLADNHAYLLSFWCLAVTLALTSPNPGTILSSNARWLIMLVFLLASLQKWFSPSYLSGVFFQYTFLVDDRFEDFVVLLTRVDYELIDTYRDYLDGGWRTGQSPPELPSDFKLLAWASTWWNLLEQPLVALAFLVRSESWLGRHRDWFLLLFCITVYAIAPVVSFGWLLLAMGMAQCRDTKLIKSSYLVLFALLLIYDQVPWAWLLQGVLEQG